MSKNTNLSFLTDYITADITNGRIGINNASPSYAFDVNGTMRTSGATYLATASGNVGIGTTTPTQGKLVVVGGVTNSIATISASFGTNNAISLGDDGTNAVLGVGNSGTDMVFLKRVAGVYSEAMRITSAGNVGIGTSSPSYKLQVNGNGYFGSGLTVEGTVSSTSLVLTAAINTYNVVQFVVSNSYSFTPPNMLTASSTNSDMRMYMVWVWGANTALYGGVRVWMIAVNGPSTAYTVSTLLSRDADAATSLDLTRTSATQLTITSNNAAAIKWVSIMQLNTHT